MSANEFAEVPHTIGSNISQGIVWLQSDGAISNRRAINHLNLSILEGLATLIGSHLTREPTASPVLTKWWKSELMLATNFGSLCPKVTNLSKLIRSLQVNYLFDRPEASKWMELSGSLRVHLHHDRYVKYQIYTIYKDQLSIKEGSSAWQQKLLKWHPRWRNNVCHTCVTHIINCNVFHIFHWKILWGTSTENRLLLTSIQWVLPSIPSTEPSANQKQGWQIILTDKGFNLDYLFA